jgi:hypothetical protein
MRIQLENQEDPGMHPITIVNLLNKTILTASHKLLSISQFLSVDHSLLTASQRLLSIMQSLSVSQLLSVGPRLLGVSQVLSIGHGLMNVDQSLSVNLELPSVDHRLLTACHRLLNVGQLLTASQFQSAVTLNVG